MSVSDLTKLTESGGPDRLRAESKWPSEVRRVEIPSTADGTLQRALAFFPQSSRPCPLLVALHSWRGDWLQDTSISYFEWCKRNGWAFVHPDFRGWSNRPEAAGSSLVVRDILDAVKFALHEGCVDARRVYMVGSSGGGMMALLMAGIAPEFWAGVSAWVPVTDLGEWFLETQSREPGYTADLLSILGGNPATDKKAALEASKRSPLTYLPAAKGIPIDICGGITDGHTGSVPLTHSLRAFNVLAQPRGRISQPDIDFMVKNQEVPITLRYGGEDPAYGKKKVLLRRSSGNARITVFQGGHEIIYEAALNWLGGLAGPLP